MVSDRKNFWLHVSEGVFASFGMQLVGGALVMPALIKKLGGSPTLIGAMMSLMAVGALIQFFSVRAFERIPRKKRLVLQIGLGMRLPYVAMAASVLLWGVSWPVAVLVVIVASRLVMSISGSLNVPPWMDMVGDTIREDWRGRYFGYRLAITCAVTLVAGGALFFMLDEENLPYPGNYSLVILVAFVFTMISWGIYCFVNDTPDDAARRKASRHEPFIEYLLSVPRFIRDDRAFRRFLIYGAVARVAGSAGLYRGNAALEIYGVPDRTVGTFMAIGAPAGIVGALVFARLGDRIGHKKNLVVASTIMVACNWLAASAGSLGAYQITFVLQGLSMGAFSVSWMSYLLGIAPEKVRMRYVSVQGLVMVPFGVLAPILAGQVVERYGYQTLFSVATALQFVGVLMALMLPARGQAISEPESGEENKGPGVS